MVEEDPEASPSKAPASGRNDRSLERPLRPHGYHAGARVEGAGRHRAELVVAVAGAIVITAVGLAMFDVVVTPPPRPSDFAERSGDPSEALQSLLPALEIAAGAPTLPMAMLAGGLRWLDPTTGGLSGTPYESFEGAPFVDRDGSVLCVCVERSWQQHGATARVALVRVRGPEAAPTRSEIMTLETATDDPFGEAIAIEVAMSPDRTAIYVATLVAGEDGFAAAITAVDPATAQLTGRTDVPLPAGEIGPAFSTLRVAPDGRSMVLTVWSTPFGQDPDDSWAAHAFHVGVTDGELAEPQPVQPLDERRGGPGCFGEAYVGPSLYGALCGRSDDAPDALSLVTSDLAGAPRSHVLPVGLGAPLDADIDAVIDAAGGQTYIWSPGRRTLVRIDSPTGDSVSQTYARSDVATMTPRLPSGTGSTVHWSRFTSARDVFNHRTIVGSSDGSVLYAIGKSPRGASRMLPSTGILVIDPHSLELLDVWAPAAYYSDIAVTADDAHVVGLGIGGIDAMGASARWDESISFHLRENGRRVEIIGTIDGLGGWTPVLLQGPG
jgi:hypothetical protein